MTFVWDEGQAAAAANPSLVVLDDALVARRWFPSVSALTIPERETIIRALDDPRPGLEELRAVLLRGHVGRVRDGLLWRKRYTRYAADGNDGGEAAS